MRNAVAAITIILSKMRSHACPYPFSQYLGITDKVNRACRQQIP